MVNGVVSYIMAIQYNMMLLRPNKTFLFKT